MKKSITFLIISICFLIGCIVWVLLSKNDDFNLRKIDEDFIKENYEINLFEDRTDENLKLNAEARYIGNYEVIKNLELKLNINCVYTYLINEEVHSDAVVEEMILIENDKILTGSIELNTSDKILNSYSCSYNVLEAKGEYK